MPIALPLITRDEIAREFRPDGSSTPAAVLRRLRTSECLSAGVSVEPRGTGGRLRGRVQLYSALNRDAARAARRHDLVTARRLSSAAARLEASPQAKRVAQSVGALGGTEDLAHALSAPELASDIAELHRSLADERATLEDRPTILTGRIKEVHDSNVLLDLDGLDAPLALPRVMLVGHGAIGSAVAATLEILSSGRTLMTVEPAVDLEINDRGEALVDLYGTPWGRVLVQADSERLKTTAPTISFPAGIPDVE